MLYLTLGVLVMLFSIWPIVSTINLLKDLKEEAKNFDLAVISKSLSVINFFSFIIIGISILVFITGFTFIDYYKLVGFQKLPIWYIVSYAILIVNSSITIKKKQLVQKAIEQVKFIKTVSKHSQLTKPDEAIAFCINIHKNSSICYMLFSLFAFAAINYTYIITG
jgi:hypothetical protein